MYIRNLRFKMILGLGLLATVMALPGSAKPTATQAAAAVVATPQSAFGLFLDPHVEPDLQFRLPTELTF